MNRVKQTFIAAVIAVSGLTAIFFLSNHLEKNNPPLPAGYADEDLSLQGAHLKGFVLGAEGLIADWYWMKSLQYIGEKVHQAEGAVNIDDLKPLNPRLLYPYLDNAAALDPKFFAVYEYGAVVLPAIDARQAIEFVGKGIDSNPNDHRLYHHLGYIYWRLGDFENAARVYGDGAKLPGAPPFMQVMSAKMRTEGGSRDTARAIYRQMIGESGDERIKETAEARLAELDAFDERDAIRSALSQFKEKNNRCASNLPEILPLLRSVKLPGGQDFRIDKANNLIDPNGKPYLFDKQSCDLKPEAQK